MPLPNLVVIGAQKAGTSTLHEMLRGHADASMSDPKELNFFNWHFDRGAAWYGAQFGDAQLRGESCPQYAAYPAWPEVPARMAATIPTAKIGYLVRNPADRIRSAWMHATAVGSETRGFDEVLADPELGTSVYAAHTRYAAQLERYLEFFPREQILVLPLERLVQAPASVLREVTDHVGVDPLSPAPDVHANASDARRRPPGIARWLLGRNNGWFRPRSAWELRLSAALTRRWGLPIDRPPLTTEARHQVDHVLAEDLDRFRDLTGINFRLA